MFFPHGSFHYWVNWRSRSINSRSRSFLWKSGYIMWAGLSIKFLLFAAELLLWGRHWIAMCQTLLHDVFIWNLPKLYLLLGQSYPINVLLWHLKHSLCCCSCYCLSRISLLDKTEDWSITPCISVFSTHFCFCFLHLNPSKAMNSIPGIYGWM